MFTDWKNEFLKGPYYLKKPTESMQSPSKSNGILHRYRTKKMFKFVWNNK